MEGKGQLYLYDIRQSALLQAKKRLKRADVQNAQIVNEKKLKKLKGKMDWVLVDAPCSGTGTLRRNPDMKWKLTPEGIDRLTEDQKQIFKTALTFLKPGATIVYATCSILPSENELQASFFASNHHLTPTASFKSIPKDGEMDGFFSQSFVK